MNNWLKAILGVMAIMILLPVLTISLGDMYVAIQS